MATMRTVRKVNIRCPVATDTFAALVRGEFTALESDPWAARMLAVIRSYPLFGDLGLYHGVFEAALSIEGFTPTDRATPTAGSPGCNTLSPTVTITTYLDDQAEPRAMQAAFDALLAAHPWEVPVIELEREPVQLLLRS